MSDDTLDRITAELRTAKDGIEIEMLSQTMTAMATALKLKSPAEKALELQLEELAPWGISVYIDRMRHAVEVFHEAGNLADVLFESEGEGCTFDNEGDLVVDAVLEGRVQEVVWEFFEEIGLVPPRAFTVGPLPAELM